MAKGPAQVKTPTEPQKAYKVVGLQKSDYMPIALGGREYNLADLTDEEARFLADRTEYVVLLS